MRVMIDTSSYLKQTQDYIDAVVKYIKSRQEIDGTVEGLINDLAYFYNMALIAKEGITKNGLVSIGIKGTLVQSPYVRCLLDAQGRIEKLQQELALTPMSQGKLKQPQKDDTEDFLSALTK